MRCGGSGGGGGSTMFLICPATNLLVDKNSVKYGLRKKIVPQEGYGKKTYSLGISIFYIHRVMNILDIEQERY